MQHSSSMLAVYAARRPATKPLPYLRMLMHTSNSSITAVPFKSHCQYIRIWFTNSLHSCICHVRSSNSSSSRRRKLITATGPVCTSGTDARCMRDLVVGDMLHNAIRVPCSHRESTLNTTIITTTTTTTYLLINSHCLLALAHTLPTTHAHTHTLSLALSFSADVMLLPCCCFCCRRALTTTRTVCTSIVRTRRPSNTCPAHGLMLSCCIFCSGVLYVALLFAAAEHARGQGLRAHCDGAVQWRRAV